MEQQYKTEVPFEANVEADKDGGRQDPVPKEHHGEVFSCDENDVPAFVCRYLEQIDRATMNPIHDVTRNRMKDAHARVLYFKNGDDVGGLLAYKYLRERKRTRPRTARDQCIEVLAIHNACEGGRGRASALVNALKELATKENAVISVCSPPCLSKVTINFWMKNEFTPSRDVLKMRTVSDGFQGHVGEVLNAELTWKSDIPFDEGLAFKVRQKFFTQPSHHGAQ